MLKHRIETEESLQELIEQFVCIHLDVNDPAFQQWSQKYPPRSSMVPMVFIVSSSGQAIYHDSGAPSSARLAEILRQGLRENSTHLEVQLARVAQQRQLAARKAADLVDQREYREAIQVLKPYFSDDQHSQTGAAAAEDSLGAVRSRLRQLGRTYLEKASKYLSDDQNQLFGLLALAKTRRVFGELPELTAQADQLFQQVQQDSEMTDELSQAELIDRGRAAEQSGDYTAAMAIFRQTAAAYRGTLAERLCAVRLKQLAGLQVAARPDSEDDPTAAR
jgi:hypothetical protein